MPKPFVYTVRRRAIMQIVMVLILGGTLGLAALVKQYRQNDPGIALGKSMPLGLLTVSLPVSWARAPGQEFTPPAKFAIEAQEPYDPDNGFDGRNVRIVQQWVGPGIKPEAFLWQEWRVQNVKAEPIKIAGRDGILLRKFDEQSASTATILYACTTLPGNLVVAVALEVPQRDVNARDMQLLAEIAGRIRYTPPAPME